MMTVVVLGLLVLVLGVVVLSPYSRSVIWVTVNLLNSSTDIDGGMVKGRGPIHQLQVLTS